ncbi:hypothetical protein D3875_15795 [Deinococcus cavernae]|uniref:HAD family hydrolase n=1 Tax=Deinococcus cavernae TaxID=2320857 RepID=A0A418VCD5_9DEIO|nr:HAD hydrolase-like protein [Deinococcus cavernae]RJF73808.1 hypothetical protein D3875_15795 [Deinococcus cavernae]
MAALSRHAPPSPAARLFCHSLCSGNIAKKQAIFPQWVSEAWFVGDSPQNDVWGPQQVGLKTAFLQTGHALKDEHPEVILGDLREVLSLVT